MAVSAWPWLMALFAVASAYQYIHPMENPDLFQGDIVGEDEDRNAVPTKNRRWPGGIIPYVIDPSLRVYDIRIRFAMKDIEKVTCIRFVPYDGTQKAHIRVFSGQGCYSYWGYVGGGEQPVSLGPGCQWQGTMLHELIHAIGFAHEQNRSDRDDYLTIYWDNIKPEFKDQFNKLRSEQNWLITPFDYNSIMIYGEMSFSKDKKQGLKTMVAKKAGVRLVQPDHKNKISPDDIKRINILYDCPQK